MGHLCYVLARNRLYSGAMATRSGCVDLEPLVLTCPQAAKRLQVSESNCRSLIRAGELPYVQLRGRVLVPVKALEAYILSKTLKGEAARQAQAERRAEAAARKAEAAR